MATYSEISYGSTGDEVKKLQELLNSKGNYNLDIDGSFGPKTQSAVKDYQQKNNLKVDGIVGENTWGALTKASSGASTSTSGTTANTGFKYEAYKPSDTVSQAEALLKQQLAQKPGAYTSAWQTQLDETLKKILNREEFSYDLNGDALYQQYKDQYTTQGKMAMMDTMGQAAAMTGGYGNSYAQSVGQQTYQGYLQQLNDRVPELYQLALDQYNREGDELYNQASLMASKEEQDYGRYRDSVSDYYTELDRLTEDARYQSEQDYGKWADNVNLQYGMYRDKVADEQWQAEFDEAKRQYDQAYALQKGGSSGGSGGSSGGSGGGSGYSSETAKIQQQLRDAGYDIEVDGYWGPKTQAAYDAYNNSVSPEPSESKSDYADWDQGDWEHYFAAIRQKEGRAAAEEELNYFTSKGYIPKSMVNAAAIGARGGSMGH